MALISFHNDGGCKSVEFRQCRLLTIRVLRNSRRYQTIRNGVSDNDLPIFETGKDGFIYTV